MERLVGTVSRGIRAPIIREGDDIAQIVVDSVLAASAQAGFTLGEKDIVSFSVIPNTFSPALTISNTIRT